MTAAIEENGFMVCLLFSVIPAQAGIQATTEYCHGLTQIENNSGLLNRECTRIHANVFLNFSRSFASISGSRHRALIGEILVAADNVLI